MDTNDKHARSREHSKDEIGCVLQDLDKEMRENGWLDHLIRAVEKLIRTQASSQVARYKKLLGDTLPSEENVTEAEVCKYMEALEGRQRFIIDKLPIRSLGGTTNYGRVWFYGNTAVICYPRFVLGEDLGAASSEGYDEKWRWNKTRVILGHELGHILLHCYPADKNGVFVYYPGKENDDAKKRRMENEASLFAHRAILLWSERFNKRVGEYYDIDDGYIRDIIKSVDVEYDSDMLPES